MTHPESLASQIHSEIQALTTPNTPHIRGVRRAWSRQLRDAPGEIVLEVARRLHQVHGLGWVGFELIRYHPNALSLITAVECEAFGHGMDSWGAVDAFGGLLAGPAWMRGQNRDDDVHRWAHSDDRWWRRAALVCTVVFNTPSHGGHGDAPRTLAVCRLLVDDHDDMVVKGLSWALRKLVAHDPEAVRGFLAEYDAVLAARVKREVNNKLATGLKNPRVNR
ncbi:MAG: DNA alkylation repair protein [Deltaproteobacteria bacterium]|nr:DNA alkylation repair protein [Deltaproteobacteria bacterium]